jgi:hypothetical protein
MRLRGDRRGEIGVFEDLQTLVIIVVGISVLLSSTLFNWSSFGAVEEEQELYDEAEHILDMLEDTDRLRPLDSHGDPYLELLSQSELLTFQEFPTSFREEFRSDLHYNIRFDDLVVHETNTTASPKKYSDYEFGKKVPGDVDSVSIDVQYVLVLDKFPESGDEIERHPCRVTVVVWR